MKAIVEKKRIELDEELLVEGRIECEASLEANTLKVILPQSESAEKAKERLQHFRYLGRPSKDLAMNGKKKDIVQARNPKSGRYIKIDRSAGKIISHKRTKGPYKGVPIARKRPK